MKIQRVSVKNFKRFTNLEIQDIPRSAKLVLLVGPNGCGKSSMFDAFIQWFKPRTGFGYTSDRNYYPKDFDADYDPMRDIDIDFHDNEPIKPNSLYVRTAYRNEASFSVSSLTLNDNPGEDYRIGRLIDDDKSVSTNYQRLVLNTTAAVYDPENDLKNTKTLRDELIGEIQTSLRKVFGDVELNNIISPLGGDQSSGSFFFSKGTVDQYHYMNLSGGEKAAFDLILDIHLKKKFYENTIYCIDEIESHLHTKMQGAILREITDVVPDGSQLWVTTHSLGVLRAAQRLEEKSPGLVSILDFDRSNLDQNVRLKPATLDRMTLEKMFSIMLDDLPLGLGPENVVVCEGSSLGGNRADFDADIFGTVFDSYRDEIVFVSGGSSNQVAQTGNTVGGILERIFPEANVTVVVDRDSKTQKEITDFEGIVLKERNLESYIFADDVLEALVNEFQKPELLQSALNIKQRELQNSAARNNAPDDLKSASGSIHVALGRLLEMTQAGGSVNVFMRDILAPLIKPGLPTYDKLKIEIIDAVRKI